MWLLLARAIASSDAPACPAGMALVTGGDGPFCIHRYEAYFWGDPGHADQGTAFPDGSTKGIVVAERGRVPTTSISWYQAQAACAQAGHHLCTSEEWTAACAGSPARAFPTPDGAYHPGACALGEGQARAQTLPLPAGARPDCHTPEGVYDLLGNVWEWTDPEKRDAAGRPVTEKRGAARYTMDATPCGFVARGDHPPTFKGSVGFRCCAEAGTVTR